MQPSQVTPQANILYAPSPIDEKYNKNNYKNNESAHTLCSLTFANVHPAKTLFGE
jgi:hypothetical protein